MKLTRLEFSRIIKELKSRFSLPEHQTVSQYVANEIGVSECDCIQDIIKYELKRFVQLGKKYQSDDIVIDSDNVVIDSDNVVIDSDIVEHSQYCPSTPGSHSCLQISHISMPEHRPSTPEPSPSSPEPHPLSPKRCKTLQEVSRKQILRRTEQIWKYINVVASKEYIKVSQLLGVLLTRCEAKDIQTLGSDLWEDNTKEQQLSVDITLAMYTDCNLGRESYTKQKKLLDSYGFHVLRPWKHLRNRQLTLTPAVKELPAPHNGVYFPLLEAVKITVERVLTTISIEPEKISSDLKLKIKFGFDGSGSHSIYNQINNMQTNNIIMTMFCPLVIEDSNGSAVWSNDSPNDPLTQCPVALQLGKVSTDSLQSLALFNQDMASMKEGIRIGDSSVEVQISSYMMDRKAVDLYFGIGGAYCDLCNASRKESMDVNIVKNGFSITKNITNLNIIYDELLQLDGTVRKETGDYAHRQGITNKPIATYQAPTVQVLHALLRSFDFFHETCSSCQSRSV